MIITNLVEHIEQDEEVIYIFKENESGSVTVFVVAVLDCEMVTLSKDYESREQAMRDIKEIEISIRAQNDFTIV